MTNPQSKTKRSLSTGEAGVLFILLLGLIVTIGVVVPPHRGGEQTDATVTKQPAATADDGMTARQPVAASGSVAGSDGPEGVADTTVVATADAPVDTVAANPLARLTAASALDIYRAGEQAYHDRDDGRAVDLLAIYTKRRPENAWGHYLLGLALRRVGALDNAESSLRRALELSPNHLKSRINLARVLLDRGDTEEAVVQALQATALDSTDVAAHRVAGLALAAAGRANEAEREYRRALALDPGDAWTLNDLGLLLIRQERFAAALPLLARAVRVNDRVAAFHNNLGVALERSGRPAAAAEAYAAAAALSPDDPRPAASRQRCLAMAAAATSPEPPVDLKALAASATTDDGDSGEALVARLEDEER